MGDEFMRDLTIDREGVEEAFMPFDELLDRHCIAGRQPRLLDDALQGLSPVDAPGSRRSGPGRRLDDQRVADRFREIACILRRLRARGLGTGNAGAPERGLPRRLVAAQPGAFW